MKNGRMRVSLTIAVIALIVCLAVGFSACSGSSVFSGAGKSAYEIAVSNGFAGTEQEWLDSLKGTAVYSDSAYDLAVEYGFTGTEAEWLASLKGESGEKGETTTSTAVNKAILSVVSVSANFTKTVKTFDRYGRVIGSEDSTYGSAGSGVIFGGNKQDGVAYIVTNFHVVYDVDSNSKVSNDISVYLYGMELEKYEISAEYVGGSMTYDVAVLKIDSDVYADSNALACDIGSSGDMTVGDSVLAIGNPEADGIAVTAGILSLESEYIQMTGADNATSLTFRVMRVDAAVNPGNSGGGLFNDSGELVGIVNAKIVSDEIEGIAYAIPIDLAYAAVTNIIENCDGVSNKSIKRCMMGITVGVTDSYTEIDEDNGKVKIFNEVSIVEVEEGSVAASAGIMANDVINSIRFESKLHDVNREYDITNLSLLFAEGDVIYVNVTRGGVTLDIDVTLGAPITVK